MKPGGHPSAALLQRCAGVGKHRSWLLAVIALLALPQQASANAGTPLLWASMLHLAIGNALIGVLEGFLLARLFRLKPGKAIGVLIAANYFSTWVGGFLIRGVVVKSFPIDLSNAWIWFWAMVFAMYLLTLLLEWPFVAWALRGGPNGLWSSVRASFHIQSISCVLLFGWYWMASETSLYTRMHVVAPGELSLPDSVLVYYIDPSDGDVYRKRLAHGGERQRVFDLSSTNPYDALFVRPNPIEPGRWDLVARLETEDFRTPRFVEVVANMFVEAAPDWRSKHTDPPQYLGTRFAFGEVQPLGVATNSAWKFWAGFWAASGLQSSRETSGEQFRFAYETPFVDWTVRYAVHLPTDKVLFQLGQNQICAFDPATRKVALLWHGRGPVPVIEQKTAGGPSH